MQEDPGTSHATSAISEDWQVGLALWFVASWMALVAIFSTSMVTVGGASAAGGRSDFGDILDVVARWTLSSSAHIDWSAPVLVTAAFALAAICAAPIQERPGFASPIPVFALAATIIATTLTVWAACAGITLLRLAALEAENPRVWEQFGAVSGIFLVAPLGVIAGMSTGRFQLLPLPVRTAAAREQVERLEAEADELAALPENSERPAAYRFARYGAPLLLALALLGISLISLAAAGWPSGVAPALVIAPLFVFGFSAFCAAFGATLAAAPTGFFSTGGSDGRRPTALGWIIGALLLAGAATPVAVAGYLSASVAGDPFVGTPAELAALWLAVIPPILAAALYGVVLLLPVSVRGHRAAARRARVKQLASARGSLERLEAQVRAISGGSSAAASS